MGKTVKGHLKFPLNKRTYMGFKNKPVGNVSINHAPHIPKLYIKWVRAQDNEIEQWAYIGAILAGVRRVHKNAWKNRKVGAERPESPSGRFEVVINLCADSKIHVVGALPIEGGFVRVRKIK